jgi:hypothetical protein
MQIHFMHKNKNAVLMHDWLLPRSIIVFYIKGWSRGFSSFHIFSVNKQSTIQLNTSHDNLFLNLSSFLREYVFFVAFMHLPRLALITFLRN